MTPTVTPCSWLYDLPHSLIIWHPSLDMIPHNAVLSWYGMAVHNIDLSHLLIWPSLPVNMTPIMTPCSWLYDLPLPLIWSLTTHVLHFRTPPGQRLGHRGKNRSIRSPTARHRTISSSSQSRKSRRRQTDRIAAVFPQTGQRGDWTIEAIACRHDLC